MQLTILVATGNPHKVTEILPFMYNRPVALKSLADFDTVPEIVENGNSFRENALIKAHVCFEHYGMPIIADDSGLEVPILNNAPGIYSSRFSGEDASDLQNNLYLLEKMKPFSGDQRKARFVCTVCYKDRNYEKIFTGITEGIILEDFVGSSGFGYDPLFYLPEIGKTYAELSREEKKSLSHRGKAMRKLLTFLDKTILFS